EKYPEVTLRHFATMTSGYDAVNPKNKGYGDDPDDGSHSPLVPTDPAFAPGAKFSYFDDAMSMFGYVLTKIAGTDLESYFRKHIARPIGMKDSSWEWRDNYDNTDRTLSNPEGVDVRSAPGGMNITAREMARLGHLFLNRGNWNGKQIVSSKWVDEATRVQVPPTMKYRDDSRRQRRLGSRGVGTYGYGWWVNGIGRTGTRLWPDAPVGTYYAPGYNNNMCIVIPEWNMVIVRMGTSGYPRRHIEVWNTFLKKVGEAIGDKPILTGERKAWQTATISFSGPQASESDRSPNPFLDYRLQVKFTGPSGRSYNVPGFFDGNGQGRGKGNVWRVRFTPDEAGSWSYTTSFRQGREVAIDLSPTAGKAYSYINGTSGRFDVAARNADADGFLSKGRLVYEEGSYYLKTLGDGKYWIKGGTDSPENFLAYNGFVNTSGREDKPEWFHDFDRHVRDWNNGDPDWDGGKGKGIIGSLN
ncbi:MAG: serine hydrolase, partial [Sedimentisphaerales bacterium]|nr:serine hydrolase [Sedimentisphaerales bacterium]